jgi:hypothetical protein
VVTSFAMPSAVLSACLRRRLLLVVAPVVLSACSSSPTPAAPGSTPGTGASPATTPATSGSAVAPRPPPVEAEGRPLFIDDQQILASLAFGVVWG